MAKTYEEVLLESKDALRNWLLKNHSQKKSIWLVTWKKSSGKPYLSYDDIVDQCLCFGWIDSLQKKRNEQQTMLRVSPRNPKSNWSGVNKKKVERLIEEGLMDPSGLELINLAKSSGTWNFLDDVEKLLIPEDLDEEFQRFTGSKNRFQNFPSSSQRGILEWIKTARTPETRRKRLLDTASKAALNIKANHPKGRDGGPKDPPLES